jgi:hypothetical protein
VLPRRVLILALAALLIGGAFLLTRSADATTDLTGTWTTDWAGAAGPPPIPCSTAAIKQHGSALHVNVYCPPSTKLFSGTYDKGAGTFTVAGVLLCKGFIEVPWTLTGTVTPDGNSISGTWDTLCITPISGTFSGQRAGPATVTFTPPVTATPPPVGGISDVPPASGQADRGGLTIALATIVTVAVGAGAAFLLRRTAS